MFVIVSQRIHKRTCKEDLNTVTIMSDGLGFFCIKLLTEFANIWIDEYIHPKSPCISYDRLYRVAIKFIYDLLDWQKYTDVVFMLIVCNAVMLIETL